MPAVPPLSYPGVYVQEVPSGVRTITGVSTSIAAFVGMMRRGRLQIPTRVLGFPDYERKFGTDLATSEMTDQVRQFFLNGGRDAWITRIAKNADTASVQLKNETDIPVLTVRAREPGPDGNLIRVQVDYETAHPEQTFNLRAFQVGTTALGAERIEAEKKYSELSMDPSNRGYVRTVINEQSELIEVDVAEGLTPSYGFSLAGLLLEAGDDEAVTTLNGLLGENSNSIQISVDGDPFVPVVLPYPLTTTLLEGLEQLEQAINLALATFSKRVTVRLVPGPENTRYLEVRSVTVNGTANPGGAVEIQPAATNDASLALQLGVSQGGVEVSGHAKFRPAPTGFFARMGAGVVPALTSFASAADLGTWTLTYNGGASTHTATPIFSSPDDPMYTGTVYTGAGAGSLLNVRENLQILADSINANAKSATGEDMWQAALQGYRLVLRPRFGGVNADITATLTSGGAYGLGSSVGFFDTNDTTANIAAYSLGSTGVGNFQTPGPNGTPGVIPESAEYKAAFDTIERNVDLFNLLILPRAKDQTDEERRRLWGMASTFCQKRRAFLLMDPPSKWKTANDVEKEIDQLRIGLVKDHVAIYWPRIKVNTPGAIDPSGSIAGVMARTDANRGVWKAPAGIEADIRGVRGVEHRMSDPENGVINPKAVNAIRVFPNGIVGWGARTMDGFDNSGNLDYKYIPIRRLALYIEESLYRGLKWVVFEPNDEPLWAQIRLNVGAFMQDLFRQGAFQGQKRNDAYFVKCDSETTTQNDINLGRVNIWVGFAPLKPAEFVILYLQQMAGQIQV